MKTFRVEPILNGLFQVIVDGKEIEGEYSQAQLGEIYAELWEEGGVQVVPHLKGDNNA